jgi:sulfite reductase (NADPH) hemoprotein beta-component
MPTAAGLLHEFLPASELLRVAEAVLHVFRRFGDYQHKQRNRMKFMIRELGWTRWREEYEKELAKIRLTGSVPTLVFDPPKTEPRLDTPESRPPSPVEIAARVASGRVAGPGIHPVVVPFLRAGDDAYVRWHTTNVRAQKQSGYVMAVVTVPLGDLTSEQMRVIAELSLAFSDGTVRVTPDQNLLFRWVSASNVRPLHRRLAAAGLGRPDAGTMADVSSCPGAESCRLAVTQSRGLARLLETHLRDRRTPFAADGARIKISGCPNGCGQHHIAAIGFQGSVRRVGSKAVPQYFVMVGGRVDGGVAFARLAAKVPARRIPEVVDRLIGLYATEKYDGESADAFFERVSLDRVKSELSDLERMTPEEFTADDFVDPGETAEFRPDVREGECSA